MDIIWILEKPSKHSLSLIAEPNSDCIACSYSIFKQTFNQYVRKWYSSLDKSMYRNFMFGKLIYDTFQCKCKLQWNASFTGFCGNSKFSHFASFHDKNFEECKPKSKFFLIAFDCYHLDWAFCVYQDKDDSWVWASKPGYQNFCQTYCGHSETWHGYRLLSYQ